MERRKHSAIDVIRIYFFYVRLIAKSNFEYRFNSILIGFAVFLREFVNIAVIYFLFTKFASLQGWSLNELFFLYSFLFLSYSLVAFFFTGIRDFENMVYEGDFDRFLCRPLGPLLQVIACKSDYAAALGHSAIGILLFFASANSVGISWNLPNMLYLISSITGGVMIQAAIFLIASSFSFWTIKTTNIRNLLFFNTRKFSGYPLTIYPFFVRLIIIYIIPFAFVNFFPAQYFLEKSDMAFSRLHLYLTPIVGVLMSFAAYLFWKRGIRNYLSVGN